MNNRILLTLDGSAFAERALDLAIDFAQKRQAELCLLQVVPLEDRLSASEDYLKSKAELVSKHQLDCTTQSMLGSASEVILEQSRKADLIVMTSHGHSQFDQIVLGSVTEKVIRKSACPVFVLRDRQLRLRDMRRILVPLDGHDLCLNALAEAVKICQSTGAHLVLCRVDETVGVEIGLVSKDEESRRMQKYLGEIAESIDSSVTVETTYEFGSAARSLLRIIDTKNIDLVVMTSHGRGGFNRWVCGSVAENILRSSKAPILLVRPKDDISSDSADIEEHSKSST